MDRALNHWGRALPVDGGNDDDDGADTGTDTAMPDDDDDDDIASLASEPSSSLQPSSFQSSLLSDVSRRPGPRGPPAMYSETITSFRQTEDQQEEMRSLLDKPRRRRCFPAPQWRFHSSTSGLGSYVVCGENDIDLFDILTLAAASTYSIS